MVHLCCERWRTGRLFLVDTVRGMIECESVQAYCKGGCPFRSLTQGARAWSRAIYIQKVPCSLRFVNTPCLLRRRHFRPLRASSPAALSHVLLCVSRRHAFATRFQIVISTLIENSEDVAECVKWSTNSRFSFWVSCATCRPTSSRPSIMFTHLGGLTSGT
jgi:hypothetical protein